MGDARWRPRGGRDFQAAAVRELREETGIELGHPGAHVARREVVLQLPDGAHVMADERYFVVHADGRAVTRGGWTDQERRVMTDHRWWSVAELERTEHTVWPEDLPALWRSVRCAAS